MRGSVARRRTGIASIGLLALVASAHAQTAWKPVSGRIMTRWAKDVSPQNVLPEYPRPTMVRKDWLNLNGLWNYTIAGAGAQTASGQILVPFPPESALSGVGKVLEPSQTLTYTRTFAVPQGWKDQRVVLHFGAVDWHASVRVNGKDLGEHKGGYDPFSFDITDALKTGDNEITVVVKDPTDNGGQPRGKQWLKPGGIWYTPTSGIWQTVWIEPVPAVSIAALRLNGTARDGTARVSVRTSQPEQKTGVEIEILTGGKSIASVQSSEGGELSIKLPAPRLWTPDDPFLYDLRVRLTKDGKTIDEVTSYIALRDITVAPDKQNVNRLMLNGEPVFQYGPLDQGFWPDGLYTAPTDEALRFDVEAVKRMGGNMLRKHVKVEPERLYYWCDKIGILVWQDMPSPFFRDKNDDPRPEISAEWKANFEREMHEMVRDFGNHPSIVMWVPFNEGWGQNDIDWSRQMALKVKEWDPTRVVNNASGWTDMKVGDTFDIHSYPGPSLAPPDSSRAGVLGEFGGLGLPVENHTWLARDNWGYVSYPNKDALTEAYVGLMKQIPLLVGQGLSAAVYTQTTDVEIEVNGWLTYDREVWKIDPDKARAATLPIYGPAPTVKTLVKHAGEGAKATWRFTNRDPGKGWSDAAFDDSSWTQGAGGFGTQGTPGAAIGTEWNTPEIWTRRTFDLEAVPVNPYLMLHHDEDVEVYINGVLAFSRKGYTGGYMMYPMNADGVRALKKGANTIAISCRQTRGGQFIDAGLIDIVPQPTQPK